MVLAAAIALGHAMESTLEAEGWPVLRYDRFDSEDLADYRRRVSEIESIREGFRMGRFRGDVAERMVRRLVRLQAQPLEALPA
jgi:hypothetical protein